MESPRFREDIGSRTSHAYTHAVYFFSRTLLELSGACCALSHVLCSEQPSYPFLNLLLRRTRTRKRRRELALRSLQLIAKSTDLFSKSTTVRF